MRQACDRACKTCLNNLCTHKIPIFSNLPYEALEKIALKIEHETLSAGTVITDLDEENTRITIISEGQVKAYRYTADGREQILYIFSEGDFFGERDILYAQRSPFRVEALTEVKLCHLTSVRFHELLFEHQEIALQIIEALSKRLQRLEQVIQNMGQRSIEARISVALLDFASQYGLKRPNGILIKLPLSREGFASYIGIARETLSRKMSQFEQEGLLENIGHKSILIRDEKALKTYSDL